MNLERGLRKLLEQHGGVWIGTIAALARELGGWSSPQHLSRALKERAGNLSDAGLLVGVPTHTAKGTVVRLELRPET